MNVGDLLSHFRMRLVDYGAPVPFEPLLITYLDNAYKTFINGIEGVPDEESVVVLAGTQDVTLPSYVLKIKSAQRSDGKFVEVINRADTRREGVTRYGREQTAISFDKDGEINYLMIGVKPNAGKVANTPLVDTTLILDIDRLPKTTLAAKTDTLDDVGNVWVLNIVDGAMAMLLKSSRDKDTFRRAAELDGVFSGAIAQAKSEKARARSKLVRVVRYGGV